MPYRSPPLCVYVLYACVCACEPLYLKDGEKGLPEGVEVTAGCHVILKVEPATKELHAQQGEDDNEEEKQQQETGNGTHTVQQ